jgi:hypothetical protein
MDNRCAYRETPAKIELRRLEGYVAVEMEAAAVAAVAAFRGVPLAQVLYGGDDLLGKNWDHRSWQSHARGPRQPDRRRRVGRPANPHAQLDLTLVSVSDR